MADAGSEQNLRQQRHEAIARAARAASATASTLANGVSSHKMPSCVSFAQIGALLAAADEHASRAFVGTVGETAVFSVNFGYRAPSEASKGKRKRHPEEDAVEDGLAKVKNADAEMLAEVRRGVLALLLVRGASGEKAVESWGVSAKTEDPERPELILSLRLTPGVAVPVAALKQALGPRCFRDGMVTTSSAGLDSKFQLPLSEQAVAAEKRGLKALSVFATVSPPVKA